jgi:hypothetical protein
MRIYFPVSLDELRSMERGATINFTQKIGISPTPELATILESTDIDELTLIAALSAADIAIQPSAIAVVEQDAQVLDAEIGEVEFSAVLGLADLECLLIADLKVDEISWYGIQEVDQVLSALEIN